MPRKTIGVFLRYGWKSVDGLADSIVAALEERYDVERPPPELPNLPAAEQRSLLRDLLSRASAVVGTAMCEWPRYRRAWKLDVPWAFLPLGDMPRGAYGVRPSLPYLEATDVIAFSSSADRAIFDNMIASCKARRTTLPFGVDQDLFRPFGELRRRRLRERLGLAPDQVVFLYAGRVSAEKNVHGLAHTLLHLMHELPSLMLLVVGEAADQRFGEFGTGPYDIAAYLRKLAARHPAVRERVRIFPPMEARELAELHNIADVFANLTLHHDENFGIAQVEAMSCGVPVIGTRWGGLKDTIRDGETGFHIDTWMTDCGIRVDGGQLVDSCRRLVADRALRRRLGARGREVVLEEYARPVFARRLQRLVAGLLRGRPAPAGARVNALSPTGRELDRRIRRCAPWMLVYTRPNYHLYEWLLGPYCSGRPEPAAVSDSDRVGLGPVFLVVRGRRAEVRDPLWPRNHRVGALARRLLRYLLRRLAAEHAVVVPVRDLRAAPALGGADEVDRQVARLAQAGLVVRGRGPGRRADRKEGGAGRRRSAAPAPRK